MTKITAVGVFEPLIAKNERCICLMSDELGDGQTVGTSQMRMQYAFARFTRFGGLHVPKTVA
jgi:hypothetical protein